jgi:hypothetical protein
MRLKEDEKRTEVSNHNAPEQTEKGSENGEFAILASEASLLS